MHPITTQEDDQVSHLGERKLIKAITGWLGACSPPPPHGIGDDAAVIPSSQTQTVITQDALVFQKHFDETTHPRLAGAKLLKRNISDIAAMGGKPTTAVIACLIPPNTSLAWIQAFYEGLSTCANRFSISIVGGDVTSTLSDVAFTLTLVGEPGTRILERKTGKSGDSIWVTGSLGGSIRGKHLDFEPRLAEGAWLSNLPSVTSAMDISDGLATDLSHLCPNCCIAEVNTDLLPLSSACLELEALSGKSPIEHALTDGEDYELLFTLDRSVSSKVFLKQWKDTNNLSVTKIGKLVQSDNIDQPKIRFVGSSIPQLKDGYAHF
jgi:thiamine-monophosphate kinase